MAHQARPRRGPALANPCNEPLCPRQPTDTEPLLPFLQPPQPGPSSQSWGGDGTLHACVVHCRFSRAHETDCQSSNIHRLTATAMTTSWCAATFVRLIRTMNADRSRCSNRNGVGLRLHRRLLQMPESTKPNGTVLQSKRHKACFTSRSLTGTRIAPGSQAPSLHRWWAVFWDVFVARSQRATNRNANADSYVEASWLKQIRLSSRTDTLLMPSPRLSGPSESL